MIWIGLSVATLIAAVIVLARPERRAKDLGSVSSQWIAEHRTEAR